MSEYAALPVLLFLALYSPQRITQSLLSTLVEQFALALGGEQGHSAKTECV